jgi:hypothetical protein
VGATHHPRRSDLTALGVNGLPKLGTQRGCEPIRYSTECSTNAEVSFLRVRHYAPVLYVPNHRLNVRVDGALYSRLLGVARRPPYGGFRRVWGHGNANPCVSPVWGPNHPRSKGLLRVWRCRLPKVFGTTHCQAGPVVVSATNVLTNHVGLSTAMEEVEILFTSSSRCVDTKLCLSGLLDEPTCMAIPLCLDDPELDIGTDEWSNTITHMLLTEAQASHTPISTSFFNHISGCLVSVWDTVTGVFTSPLWLIRIFGAAALAIFVVACVISLMNRP